jgi:hypothetical protein
VPHAWDGPLRAAILLTLSPRHRCAARRRSTRPNSKQAWAARDLGRVSARRSWRAVSGAWTSLARQRRAAVRAERRQAHDAGIKLKIVTLCRLRDRSAGLHVHDHARTFAPLTTASCRGPVHRGNGDPTINTRQGAARVLAGGLTRCARPASARSAGASSATTRHSTNWVSGRDGRGTISRPGTPRPRARCSSTRTRRP